MHFNQGLQNICTLSLVKTVMLLERFILHSFLNLFQCWLMFNSLSVENLKIQERFMNRELMNRELRLTLQRESTAVPF